MQALAWGNLQLDGERPELLVEGEHLKTASSHRRVSLTGPVVAIFRTRLDALAEAPVSEDPVWEAGQRNYATARSAWVRIRKSAKLGRARIHDLRHTYGGHLVRAGVALPVIKTLMGHSSARTTMRYLEFADAEDTSRAARLLESHVAGK
jgi:integrase